MAARLRALTVVALLILASASGGVTAQQPDTGAFVRVDATQCSTGSRRASGFVWNGPSTVVTSLHVVAGCNTISIRYAVRGGQLRTARVDRVLPAADLALLMVTDPVAVPPLRTAAAMPAAGAELTAWGYPIQVRGLMDTTFKRRATAGKLSDLLNQSVLQEVQRVGMPDVSAEVILLDSGNLLPGHSGAPLVNGSGLVAAIADGGLERGAVQISWAIPATRLADLERSTQRTVDGSGAAVAQLFSAELVTTEDTQNFDATVTTFARAQPSLTRASYQCGGAVFVLTRTRMLNELRASADDISGLDQLFRGSAGLVGGNDRFDIYQDFRSGATVVVPAGAPIAAYSADGTCIATVGTNLQLLFYAVVTPTLMDALNARVAFDQRMAARLGGGWQLDPSWTYTTPMIRFDGMAVTRRAAFQYASNGIAIRSLFETIAVKAGTFMVVTNLRSGFTPQMLATEQQCFISRSAGCELPLQMLRAIALANVATHLSTLPVG